MHALPATLVTLILSIVGTTTAASGDGLPQATKYIDNNSNITFLGYANKGFHFGMALPSDPKDDVIVQLVSPLKDGGGWGGVDFGASMTGPLMVVAWPNTAKENTVMVSPRIATGYEIDNGANVYICGRASMAREVGKVVEESIKTQNNWSDAEVRSWAESAKRGGKWLEDVWG